MIMRGLGCQDYCVEQSASCLELARRLGGAVADEVITKFLAPMPWSWSDLEGIGPAELYYGEIVGNAAGELTFCSNRHPTGLALGLLKRHERAAGVVMQLRFLMTSFRRNVNELFSRYDLTEDGVVKTDLKGPPEIVKRGAGKANCLVWRVGDDVKHPLYSLDRVYRFVPTSTIIPIVEHDASEIRKRLKELDPEIGYLIDRLVSG